MNKLVKNIYLNSPLYIKKIFANAEAIRRNVYRRSGGYSKHYKNINIEKMLIKGYSQETIESLNNLIENVKANIPFYQENMDTSSVQSVDDFQKVPVISKMVMKKKISAFIDTKFIKNFWSGRTSGSTGTPFSYYRDRVSMQFEYALYDKLYDYIVGHKNSVKARISGVTIANSSSVKPPFWYFIHPFNQLQCSAYHIDQQTFIYYLKAFETNKVVLGTGYASSWLFLAQYILENNVKAPVLKGIVTDSEGFSNEEKSLVEKAFNCQVFQTYGLGEVGMVAVQCKNNHYHILVDRCYVEVVNDKGERLKNGEVGEIVVTDLHAINAPFIRYRTGDVGIIEDGKCGCGWKSPYIKELFGRVDDYVITSSGRKIGRLSHIAKPAKGVQAMQLIQKQLGELDIHVIPGEDFDPKTMEDVIDVAKEYLEGMKVNWHVVQNLEKTSAGKVRYVIRKI